MLNKTIVSSELVSKANSIVHSSASNLCVLFNPFLTTIEHNRHSPFSPPYERLRQLILQCFSHPPPLFLSSLSSLALSFWVSLLGRMKFTKAKCTLERRARWELRHVVLIIPTCKDIDLVPCAGRFIEKPSRGCT